jgi:hypothetical protein
MLSKKREIKKDEITGQAESLMNQFIKESTIDMGFWNIDGEYLQDIQVINERDF